jgi:hypothetical protein
MQAVYAHLLASTTMATALALAACNLGEDAAPSNGIGVEQADAVTLAATQSNVGSFNMAPDQPLAAARAAAQRIGSAHSAAASRFGTWAAGRYRNTSCSSS